MRNMLTTLAAAAVLATTGAAVSAAAPDEASDKAAVLDTYADIAHAAFEDALTEARRLKTAVDGLTASPSAEARQAARAAWVAARVPYQQTAVLRFGTSIDDDWESSAERRVGKEGVSRRGSRWLHTQ